IVKSVEIDPGFNILTVILENVQSGKLDITLHRELIDSKINGYDDTFVVLVDGEDALYDETSSTLTERILQIAIPSGASFIEIIGTETLTGIRNEGLVTLTYEDFVFKMPIFLSTGIVDRIDIDRHGSRIVLSVSTSSTEDGELKLDLPRALLDSETDGTDKQFVIMVDGKRSDYQEDGKSRTFRTLTIKVPAGVDKVEIIGTKVVPESPRRANMQEFVDTLFKQCRAFLIQGNYEEALFYCREVLNSNPMHIEALFNTGAVLHELGRNEEVITYYDRLLQIDPNDVRVLNNKGITLCELGKCEEAIGYFDKVLVTEPYNVDALTGKGSALFSQGRVKEANALIENALEINRENVIALKIRGLILLPDSPKEAMVYFDQVLRKDPEDARVHEYRGFALLELDRFVESTESFDTSLLVMPTNTCALLGKAESMIGREKFKEAIDYYDKALAMWSYDSSSSCFIDADDLQIIKAKSYAYFKLEDHNMLRDEGHKHFENEKYVKAIVHYKNFLKLEPNNIEVLNKKGIALILLEKYNLSLMTFDKTLELEPENADALGGKGFSLLALGKNEEANRHIVTALELEPENRFALIAQAISFKIEGKFEMAMIEVDKVLKIFPENPFLLLAKA
ncbi:MAG: tetratricopeptide repeat protein, partial [Nitrososphaerales archaeon]